MQMVTAVTRFTATQQLYKQLKQMKTEQVTLPHWLHQQRVANGTQRAVAVKPHQISVWGDKSIKNYSLAVRLNHHSRNAKVLAPVHTNEKIGELEVASHDVKTIDGEPLTYSLYSSERVPVGNFWQRLWH